jgi:glycosyltransferase involved in cell wall biosynthesis
MTRVLLVYQPIDGGVARHVCDLASGLGERGYDVVLCGPARPHGAGAAPETSSDERFPHEQLALQRAIGPRADLAGLSAYARIVSRVRPGIIHAHSSKAGAIARLGRLLHPRTPVVYTPHGYAFAGHFEREIERSAYREIERALTLLTSSVLCVCDAEARLARVVGPARKVSVVHNGIEPAGDGPVHPRVAELAREGPVIGALTLLRPGKGLETLLDAMPLVLARHPSSQLAIGGDGPDREALGSHAGRLGIAASVHFLGPTDDPLAMMRGLSVFVHPSWAESFPYAILEAMSLGLPIVASDVGGIGEALVDGQSGSLVPAAEEAPLAGALAGLLDDPNGARAMGRAALRRLQERFSRRAMVAGIAGVYGDLLGRPVPGAGAR